MTELNPPGFLQNAGATHTAQQTRIYTSDWQNRWAFSTQEAFPRSSRPYNGGLKVSAHTPNNMSVDVSQGIMFVRGSEAATQGIYTCYNDGTVNLVIGTADPTNPRKDIVIARVRDSAFSGVTNSWVLEVVAGTPAASPVEPTAPANSGIIAVVTVPAGATSIISSNISHTASTTVAGHTSAMGGFEIVISKALYDFQGAPLWVNQINDDEFWFQDFNSVNWRQFLTTLNAGMGARYGSVYQGIASLYSGTAEAAVTNLTIAAFVTHIPGTINDRFIGHVHCKVQSTVAGDRAHFRVRIDTAAGAQIGEHEVYIPQASINTPVDFSYYYPADGASHSLVLTCSRDAGTGTISVSGSGTFNRFFHLVSHEAADVFAVVS